MILALLFDMPFKDWFVGVYMHDLVPMLTDTMNILLADDQIQPVLDKINNRKEEDQRSRERRQNFVHMLAETHLRRQIARQQRMERRREERRQNGEEEEEEGEESSESEDGEDVAGVEIPDNETTRMEIQALEAQFQQRRNEGVE